MKCKKLTQLLRADMPTGDFPESFLRFVLGAMWSKYKHTPEQTTLLQYKSVGDIMLTKFNMSSACLSTLPVRFSPEAFYLSLVRSTNWQIAGSGTVTQSNSDQLMFGKMPKKKKLLLAPGLYDIFLLRVQRKNLLELGKQYPEIDWLMTNEKVGLLHDQQSAAVPFTPTTAELYGQIINDLGNPPLANPVQLERSLGRLLVLYASGLRSRLEYKAAYTVEPSFKDKLHAFIHENLQSSITVEQMANAVGMSYTVFADKCVAEFLMAPAEYLRDYRLRLAAAHLLHHSNMKVGETGWDFGFGNASHFTREFRRIFKCSPSEYRQKYGENHIL